MNTREVHMNTEGIPMNPRRFKRTQGDPNEPKGFEWTGGVPTEHQGGPIGHGKIKRSPIWTQGDPYGHREVQKGEGGLDQRRSRQRRRFRPKGRSKQKEIQTNKEKVWTRESPNKRLQGEVQLGGGKVWTLSSQRRGGPDGRENPRKDISKRRRSEVRDPKRGTQGRSREKKKRRGEGQKDKKDLDIRRCLTKGGSGQRGMSSQRKV